MERFRPARTSFSFSPSKMSLRRLKKSPADMTRSLQLLSNLSSGRSLDAKALIWLRSRRVSLYLDCTVPSSSAVTKLFSSAMLTLERQGSFRQKASCTTGSWLQAFYVAAANMIPTQRHGHHNDKGCLPHTWAAQEHNAEVLSRGYR